MPFVNRSFQYFLFTPCFQQSSLDMFVRSWKNFVEGLFRVDNKEPYKIHLVNWNQLCQPKANGGLGFKSFIFVTRQ